MAHHRSRLATPKTVAVSTTIAFISFPRITDDTAIDFRFEIYQPGSLSFLLAVIMDSLFGRKKSRPRQSSVSAQDLSEHSIPYDKLAPSLHSPTTIGTISQGIRGPPNISAPITNPTLTTNGTEFNIHAMQRSKNDRDRAYSEAKLVRSSSPNPSVSTADSSTLFDGTSGGSGRPKTPISRARRSEAPSERSSNDFGHLPYPSPTGSYPSTPVASATLRPMSTATTRSENNRGSRYPSSVASERNSHHSHMSQHFYLPNRHGNVDDFYFPRPDNVEEIEALFEDVKRTFGAEQMPELSVEHKWRMVYSAEHMKWKEERAREEQLKKQNGSAAIAENSPEWYIKKFLDRTISPKQVSSLQVTLRSTELG